MCRAPARRWLRSAAARRDALVRAGCRALAAVRRTRGSAWWATEVRGGRKFWADVLGAFIGAPKRSLRWRAKHELNLRSVDDARVGAITFVQRAERGRRPGCGVDARGLAACARAAWAHTARALRTCSCSAHPDGHVRVRFKSAREEASERTAPTRCCSSPSTSSVGSVRSSRRRVFTCCANSLLFNRTVLAGHSKDRAEVVPQQDDEPEAIEPQLALFEASDAAPLQPPPPSRHPWP